MLARWLVLAALLLSGCELVANFDRDKIPLPDGGQPDAAAPRPPPRDAGEVEPDAAPEEDAGAEADAG